MAAYPFLAEPWKKEKYHRRVFLSAVKYSYCTLAHEIIKPWGFFIGGTGRFMASIKERLAFVVGIKIFSHTAMTFFTHTDNLGALGTVSVGKNRRQYRKMKTRFSFIKAVKPFGAMKRKYHRQHRHAAIVSNGKSAVAKRADLFMIRLQGAFRINLYHLVVI